MNIIVTGDIHGDFPKLNELINKKRQNLDLVICCGDFGYWPNHKHIIHQITSIKNHGIKVLWCDGNHEDHWALKERVTDELAPNIFYMPRGSTYTLEDERNILFMGGGESIDKDDRVYGRDWFPEETINQRDLFNLPEIKIDIFITHTCPVELYPLMVKFYIGKQMEPSNHALSELWKIYKPDLWYFGHWHRFQKGNLDKTRWFSLSYPDEGSRWWIWLEDKRK